MDLYSATLTEFSMPSDYITPTNRIGLPCEIECECPVVIPVTLDFTLHDTYTVDFTSLINSNVVPYIRGVFINAVDGNAGARIDIVSSGTNQKIGCSGGTCAFLPLLGANPPVFTCISSSDMGSIQLHFLNYSPAPYQFF